MIKHITSPLRDYRRQSIDCLLGLDRFVERRHVWLPKAMCRSSYVHTGQATVSFFAPGDSVLWRARIFLKRIVQFL